MTDDAVQDSVEEELNAGRSTPTGLLWVGVAIMAAVVLVPVAMRWHDGSSGGRGPSVAAAGIGGSVFDASNPLRPTLATRYSVDSHVVYTVVMHNISGADLQVRYPIRTDAAHLTSAPVSYVGLTRTGQVIDYRHAPRRVTHIPAHGAVTLQLGLNLRCGSRSGSSGPTGRSKIAIELAGYPEPAVFTFVRLFGGHVRVDLSRVCADAGRPPARVPWLRPFRPRSSGDRAPDS